MANVNPVIEKGDHITVVEWTSHQDNSYKGDCLEVMCVDQELLRVRNIERPAGSIFGDEFTLGLNCVLVRKLSDEFVERVKLKTKAKNEV